jgi:hypothetical protein
VSVGRRTASEGSPTHPSPQIRLVRLAETRLDFPWSPQLPNPSLLSSLASIEEIGYGHPGELAKVHCLAVKQPTHTIDPEFAHATVADESRFGIWNGWTVESWQCNGHDGGMEWTMSSFPPPSQ